MLYVECLQVCLENANLRLLASLFISIGAHWCWVGQVSDPLCCDKAGARDMAFVLDAGAIFDIAVATSIRQLPQVFLCFDFQEVLYSNHFYTPRLSKGGQTKQSQKLSSVEAKHPSPGTVVRLWNYVAKNDICMHARHVWRDFVIGYVFWWWPCALLSWKERKRVFLGSNKYLPTLHKCFLFARMTIAQADWSLRWD